MKKIILITAFLLITVMAFSQSNLVATLTFANDSTSTEVRQYFLIQPSLDLRDETIILKNRVVSTTITNRDTIIISKNVRYSIAKSDSVAWRTGYIKARPVYNNFFTNGIEKIYRLNKALIQQNPNKK